MGYTCLDNLSSNFLQETLPSSSELVLWTSFWALIDAASFHSVACLFSMNTTAANLGGVDVSMKGISPILSLLLSSVSFFVLRN